MLVTVPPAEELRDIFYDDEHCMQFLRTNGLVDVPVICEHCQGRLADHGNFLKCTQAGCRRQRSIFKGSFFSKLKTPPRRVLQVGYLWLIKCPSNAITSFTGLDRQTVADLLAYFRQLVASSLSEDSTIIGGEDIVVEVDESKFGKVSENTIGGTESKESGFWAELSGR